jgi:hypothetical protein
VATFYKLMFGVFYVFTKHFTRQPDNRTTGQPDNRTTFELLLQRSNKIMRNILPVIVIFALSFILTERAFSQSPDPNLCDNGDDTDWEQPHTGWTINLPASVLGCDDPDCVVTIEYYDRQTAWGWEFTVTKINFSSSCDNDCFDNAWRTALWMLAVKHKADMGLNNPDDCYNNFVYRLATCWQLITTYGWTSYSACDDGACCSGVYNICLRVVNGVEKIEITRVSPLQFLESNCTSPCEFKQCSELMPNYLQVDTRRPDYTAHEVFKQSVNNRGSSNTMELKPNPAINAVNIHIAVQESGVYQLNVIDNIGNTVHSQSISIGSGLVFEMDLTTQEYVSGNYNVVLTNNAGLILNQQFIKIK